MGVELELYRGIIVLLNVVQVAVLVALLRWVRGNGHAAADPAGDVVEAVERYLSAGRDPSALDRSASRRRASS